MITDIDLFCRRWLTYWYLILRTTTPRTPSRCRRRYCHPHFLLMTNAKCRLCHEGRRVSIAPSHRHRCHMRMTHCRTTSLSIAPSFAPSHRHRCRRRMTRCLTSRRLCRPWSAPCGLPVRKLKNYRYKVIIEVPVQYVTIVHWWKGGKVVTRWRSRPKSEKWQLRIRDTAHLVERWRLIFENVVAYS